MIRSLCLRALLLRQNSVVQPAEISLVSSSTQKINSQLIFAMIIPLIVNHHFRRGLASGMTLFSVMPPTRLRSPRHTLFSSALTFAHPRNKVNRDQRVFSCPEIPPACQTTFYASTKPSSSPQHEIWQTSHATAGWPARVCRFHKTRPASPLVASASFMSRTYRIRSAAVPVAKKPLQFAPIVLLKFSETRACACPTVAAASDRPATTG